MATDWKAGDEIGTGTGLTATFGGGGRGSGIDGGGESGGRDEEDEGRLTAFGVHGEELESAAGASRSGSGLKNSVLNPEEE